MGSRPAGYRGSSRLRAGACSSSNGPGADTGSVRGTEKADGGLATASTTLSRRAAIRNGALGAVGAAGAASALLRAPAAEAATRSNEVATFVPNDFGLHLLRRATFGPTPGLHAHIRQMGPFNWLEQQLKPASIVNTFCQDFVANRFPMVTWTIAAGRQQPPRRRLGPDGASWARRPSARGMEQAPAVRGDGGLLVQPPERHEPVERRVGNAPRLRPHGDPQVRAGQVLRHARGVGDAPGDDDATSTTPSRPRTARTRTTGASCWSCTPWAWTPATPRTRCTASALIMTGFGIALETAEPTFKYHPDNHYTGHVKVLGWSSTNTRRRRPTRWALVLRATTWPTTRHRPPHRAQALRAVRSRRRRRAALVDEARQDVPRRTTRRSCRCCSELFHSKTFARFDRARRCSRPMRGRRGDAADPGHPPGRRSAAPTACRRSTGSIQDLGDAPLAWRAAERVPGRRPDSWRSAGGPLERWNTHMALAAHGSPARPRSFPTCRQALLPVASCPKTYGGFVDALGAAAGVPHAGGRRIATPSSGSWARPRASPLKATDAAVTWRLPYIVALILDSPYSRSVEVTTCPRRAPHRHGPRTPPPPSPAAARDLERAITRRTFLKATAAAGVVAGIAGDGHAVHPARVRVHARTPATCWWCCRCAAGSTA